jgi:hypothetical protein
MTQRNDPASVVLLTRAGCSLCEEAAGILEHLAESYPLALISLDFDSPAGQELARQCGVLFVPGVVINGTAVREGRLSERELRKEIEKRLGMAPQVESSARAVRSIFAWISRGW